MNRKIFNYFEMAAKLTTEKNDGRSFLLGAICQRKDGKLVSAINSPSQIPDRTAHSEYKICRKADVGSVVYVCRVRLMDGTFALARPCHSCMKVMTSKGIHRVYYTITNDEYGIIDL